jgi:Ribbon-helix-helix protein, copG family
MRTIIDLEDTQASRLDAWAKAEKVSRAEAVRRAVNQMLERAAVPQGTGFGLWAHGDAIGKGVPLERDGLVLQRAMRDEWSE